MTYDLHLERLVDATPEEVFDAFTDPDAHRQWYLDAPDFEVNSTVDLRVGGVWSTSFGPGRSVPYREDNHFSEVERPSRLAYRSTFTMPDGSAFDTDMVVTFEARGDKTLLSIHQSGFEREQDRDDHQGGWPSFLDRLEQVVADRRAA